MKSFKRALGLTLVELLITLAIMAALTAITVPVYTYFIDNQRLKSVAERFYHDVIYAQSEALKQHTNVTVVFQTGTTWCYGITTATNCDCQIPGNCSLGQENYLTYDDITVGLTGFLTSTTISGNRGVATNTGTVDFSTSDGDVISVIINKMGFPRICSNDIAEYQSCI